MKVRTRRKWSIPTGLRVISLSLVLVRFLQQPKKIALDVVQRCDFVPNEPIATVKILLLFLKIIARFCCCEGSFLDFLHHRQFGCCGEWLTAHFFFACC